MGKRSLARLAAYVCGFSVVSITISQTYGITDLKEDLVKYYKMAGVKSEGVVFLFTDAQITDERFLVFINDLLASGNIPDLFQQEDIDDVCNSLARAAKDAGISPEQKYVWPFFMSRVRENLHMCLAFAPNEDFRNRALKFPAVVNCTVIDWFHDWPEDALYGVAQQFLAEEELGKPNVHDGIVKFMPFAFKNVNEMRIEYLKEEKRYVYTTPKSFLECIDLYKTLLNRKRLEADTTIERLENGINKLTNTSEAVARLSAELEVQLAAAEVKKSKLMQSLRLSALKRQM